MIARSSVLENARGIERGSFLDRDSVVGPPKEAFSLARCLTRTPRLAGTRTSPPATKAKLRRRGRSCLV